MEHKKKPYKVIGHDVDIGEVIDTFKVSEYIHWTEDGYEVVDFHGNVLSFHKNPSISGGAKGGDGEPICYNERNEKVPYSEFIKDRKPTPIPNP